METSDPEIRLSARGKNSASSYYWPSLARRALGRFHASSILPRKIIIGLENVGAKVAPAVRTKMGDGDAVAIRNVYARCNEELSKMLGRDLSELGY
jgi:hypothetical protein